MEVILGNPYMKDHYSLDVDSGLGEHTGVVLKVMLKEASVG